MSGIVKKVRWLLLFSLTIALSLNSLSVLAETEFFPPVREVVVYTDGLGFVVRTGEVALSEDGVYIFDQLPPVLKGSLSVFAEDSAVQIEQVTAYQEEQTVEYPITGGKDFIRENIGRPVQVLTEEQTVTGKIKSFLEPNLFVVTVTHKNGVTADHVYPLDKVTAFYLLEPAVITKEVKEKVGKLRVKTGNLRGGGPLVLGLSYLQTGIAWVPEYTLDLQNTERGGILSFSATVQNDLDDLAGVTMYLAEDGPRFDREISPLVIFDGEARQYGKAPLYLAEVTTRGVNKQAFDLAAGIDEEYLPSMLMYKKSGITLKKGERAVLPIFQGAIRVEPIYRLELARNAYNAQLRKEPIWKGYRVHNDSAMHWVKGNVLVRMGDKPLALQEFPFVAPRGSGVIKVLTEKSILSEVTEVEFERIQAALTYHNLQYSSVQVRGEIELLNTKDENVFISVSQLIPGEVSEASDGAVLTKKANSLSGPNPQTEAVWEVTIPARGTKRLTYTYQTYVTP